MGTLWVQMKYLHHSKEIRAHLDVFFVNVSGELQCHFKTKFTQIGQSILKLRSYSV